MKHNPGPLRVEYNLDGNAVCIRCEPDEQNAGTHVADMLSSRSPEETKANAVLFAAAPELLAALEGLLTNAPKPKNIKTDYSYMVYLEAAKTAIAKAKGELP